MMDKKDIFVWDYIIWNEFTFGNANTHEKMSLFNSISDSETEKNLMNMYDYMVKKS